MRINVYNEEVSGAFEVVTRTITGPDEDRTYYGARLYLISPDELHSDEMDDDTSAVTFWFGAKEKGEIIAVLSALITEIAEEVESDG